MALKMIEGFEVSRDVSAVGLGRKWTITNTPAFTTGRLLGFSANSFDMRTKSLGVQSTWVIGFAFKPGSFLTGDEFCIELFQSSDRQLTLEFVPVTSTTYRWDLKRGATTLASSSTFATSIWNYFELKVTIDASAGAYELRGNQISLFSGSSANTSEFGSGGADIIRIFNDENDIVVDDIYILDSTGSYNTDFLGDSVVEGHIPDGDGATTDWTPSTGTDHYVLIDDPATAAPVDSDYVSSSTVTDVDLFTFPAISFITGTIFGTQLNIDARLDAAGTRDIRGKVRSGGTTYDGGVHTVNGTSFATFVEIFEEDPDTSAAWTISGLDAAEFGFELET